MFYSEQDFRTGKRRAAVSRVAMALLVAAAIVAGLVPMFLNRNMLLSIVFSSVAALIAVFLYGSLFSRIFSYQKFLNLAREGIRHTYTGAFVESGEESLRDGVRFICMSFRVNEDEEPYRCYYDASLPPLALKDGARYTVTHTGNSMLGID